MRQWLVNPRGMCRQHLLGEHNEHHMFIGTMLKGGSVQGYIKGNLLEPSLLWDRHDELADEMVRRGYHHRSPIELHPIQVMHLQSTYKDVWSTQIDREAAYEELVRRCPRCKERMECLTHI